MSDSFHPSKIVHVAGAATKDGQFCARCSIDIDVENFPLLEEGTVVSIIRRAGADSRLLHGKSVPSGYVECRPLSNEIPRINVSGEITSSVNGPNGETLITGVRLGGVSIDNSLIFVPGDYICPTCSFRLHSRTLNANTCKVGIKSGDEVEHCPNDNTPMQRLTYKQDSEEANKCALDFMKENRKLRERIAELESQRVIVKGSSAGH